MTAVITAKNKTSKAEGNINNYLATYGWLVVLPLMVSVACNLPQLLPQLMGTPYATTTPTEPTPQATPLTVTEVTFEVSIPGDASEEAQVYLNILDEVGGLAVQARSYEMELLEDGRYSMTLPFSMKSLIKYRYTRQAEVSMVEEHISDGRQLRYRMYHVDGPGIVSDVVTRWTDTQYTGQTGRISGKALDATTGQPIPNLLVVAGGAPALTSSDGSYLIEGLPPGLHNLVGFAMDGSYSTFQQGALVAAESTTPAELRLSPAGLVHVTFELQTPEDTVPAVPIRLAGDLYQLGNTFADLGGGLSTLASRMPVLALQPDGVYRLTIDLPVGADVHYLYTLGDGFWNTELFETGEYRLRQLIVPNQDIFIRDNVESWTASQSGAITFDITTPPGTPTGETISIQFKPVYGWTEPLPMWRLTENRWAYVLNHPLQSVSSLHYRFCRNNQCGTADDSATAGLSATGYPINSSLFAQTVVEDVKEWAWLSPTPVEMTVAPADVAPRGPSFSAGIELQASYHPSWQPLFPRTLDSLTATGANWLVMTPTWTYTRQSPPILDLVSGQDPFWLDLHQMIKGAKERGFNLAVFPTPHFPTAPSTWWQEAERDFAWWVVWFERYKAFMLHHADLAAASNAQALILGGDWIAPALPSGILADGSSSGVPADADERWRSLISEIRQRFPGSIAWALPYSQINQSSPTFLDAVDTIYVLFDAPLSRDLNPVRQDMAAEAGLLLDGVVGPLYQRLNKPIVLGAMFASADGSARACVPEGNGSCLPAENLERPNLDNPAVQVDLGEQEEIYGALLDAVSSRPWISGFISRGYFPPASLQDFSTSIHGKPSEALLTYWYPRLLAAP